MLYASTPKRGPFIRSPILDEGEGHASTDDHNVNLVKQVHDQLDLVSDLGTAEDAADRPGRGVHDLNRATSKHHITPHHFPAPWQSSQAPWPTGSQSTSQGIPLPPWSCGHGGRFRRHPGASFVFPAINGASARNCNDRVLTSPSF